MYLLEELIYSLICFAIGLICFAIIVVPIFLLANQCDKNTKELAKEKELKRQLEKQEYYDGEYYNITHIEYEKHQQDFGFYGEYLIFKCLEKVSQPRKFLFNLYIPYDGDKTTEIDVLMIHSSGIYVIESKNYTGWIFGSEKQKEWTQTFRNGEKYKFYNPIKQNETHIKHLTDVLVNFDNLPVYSYIVFGNDCRLKSINVKSEKHTVLYLDELLAKFYSDSENYGVVLSAETIEQIYNQLYPFSQVSDDVKKKHISDIEAISEKVKPAEIVKMKCPHCGTDMSMMGKAVIDNKIKTHWKCLNFGKCGYMMYTDENEDNSIKNV